MNVNRLAVIAAFAVVAGSQAQTITQSTSQSILSGNSVSCNSAGIHTDNYYARQFTLANFGITQPWVVSAVSFGVEAAVGTGGTQNVTVDLFDGGTAGALGANVGTATAAVTDGSLFIQSVSILGAGAVNSGSLWVRVFTPAVGSNSFFIGSNNLGQSGPSFLRADACGVTTLTDTAQINFPNMHVVMNVTGAPVPEPATMIATAIGVAGLIRRRISKK